MADEIRATPRVGATNQLLGLLADTLQGGSNFAAKPFGYDNPPVRGLLSLLPVQAITNTLNELSYGGALGTGSGMTYQPKADMLDAAMAVAPLLGGMPRAINAGAAAIGQRLEPSVNALVNRTMAQGGRPAQLLQDMAQGSRSYAIDPRDYGLPVNRDGSVTLLHGTTQDAAKKIIATGRLKSAGEPDVYLTTSPSAGYGDGTVVKVNVDPQKLFIDDEFPGGRFDFRLPTIDGQAAIKKPGLLGDTGQLTSRTEQIPVSDSFFDATGAAPAKMFADVERLRRKHPADFQTTEDLRNHLIGAYGGEPNFVSLASDPRYTLTTTPAGKVPLPTGQPYRAAVSDLRGVNGGNYQVISAFPMTEKQLTAKKMSDKK